MTPVISLLSAHHVQTSPQTSEGEGADAPKGADGMVLDEDSDTSPLKSQASSGESLTAGLTWQLADKTGMRVLSPDAQVTFRNGSCSKGCHVHQNLQWILII